MTFLHPLALALVFIPLIWVAWSWRGAVRPLTLALKGIGLALIPLALAQPVLTLPDTRTGAVVLVDTSASISQDDLARASTIVGEIARHKGRNWMRVVPFARQTRELDPQETSNGLRLVQTANEAGKGTNIEEALTASMSAMPAGHVPRLVLISDGNENEGSSARAIAELQRLDVPVDTIPLDGRDRSGLRLVSVSMPREAYAGEQIPLDLTIDAPRGTHAEIDIRADQRDLGSQPVELQTGPNLVRVHTRVKAVGVTAISGKITAPGLGALPFENALQLRRAKVLYISQDPAAYDVNLIRALSQAEFEVTRDISSLDKDLSEIELVILNNVDLNSLNPDRKTRLEEYVKNGGGLLLIGGEHQVYKDDQRMDALDRALPAKLAPPKSPEGTSVVLIIDKSSSMEGRKIELARLSAIGVVDHLRPTDTIGVLIFDNSFQWAVPMRKAEDKSLIRRLISGITPDGGTQIAPALAEAYHKVLSTRANYKHIVLLTDGISEEGDSIELAREAQQHDVTISTVGLGQDVNRTYLEKVAATSGGRSYFLNEPQGLEQILLKDVLDYTGSTTVEKPLKPIVERKAEILDGIDFETAPTLKGYVRFTAKPAAETILGIDDVKRDPLYVRWQYGLGRAGVFTSDAKSRWADAWMGWPGYDKFWINITRDLLAHADQSEATAQFDTANGDILVTYRLGPGVAEPTEAPAIFAIGPQGFQKPIDVQRTSPGVYHGRLHVGNLSGLFRIRPVNDSRAFPEIGLYRQQEELQDYGSNRPLLEQISALTGGRFNPPPQSVFDANGRSVAITWDLWPVALGLAIAFSIAELVARKWSGLMQSFQRA
ncbi:MAG TPA: VWA domain-containing protein [Bryobacteraceae bacterium]|nr:VWA domain-containing protein [Bryobacteraceae bacterium]